MQDDPPTSQPVLLHVAPPNGSDDHTVSQWIRAADLRTRHCDDVYRALAYLGRCGDAVPGVVVNVTTLGSPEMEFFSIMAREFRAARVLVYGDDQSDAKVAHALELGAAGRADQSAIQGMQWDSAPPTVCDGAGDSDDTSAAVESVDDLERRAAADGPETSASRRRNGDPDIADSAPGTAAPYAVRSQSCVDQQGGGRTGSDDAAAPIDAEDDARFPRSAADPDDRIERGWTVPRDDDHGDLATEAVGEGDGDGVVGEDSPSAIDRMPKGDVRVPWKKYADAPVRLPPRRADDEVQPVPSEYQPLLSDEELAALLGDDVPLPNRADDADSGAAP